MRGKSINFEYLGTEILNTLGEADSPMSALGVNFAINDKLGRIIELNMVRSQLETLVQKRKVKKKAGEKIDYYKLSSKGKKRHN